MRVLFLPLLILTAGTGFAKPPNILIAISDDQSYPHAGAYGSKMVHTPNFDRIAREGVLFTNAYCSSPGCSPSRAAFLTGRYNWQIEEAGTHASGFNPRYETFPQRLADDGYHIGFVGKGWSPGKAIGWQHNPAGKQYGINPRDQDYRPHLDQYWQSRPEEAPFCLWFGSGDPHRPYAPGSGRQAGKKLTDADVPAFLPDCEEIRSDLLDYAFEIDRFDGNLGYILGLIEAAGELDNTIVIVTSDNGMPFPRAKANCYELGIHIPLAIRWPSGIPAPGRIVDDLVQHIDITAAIYELTPVEPPEAFPLSGRSILSLLRSSKSGVLEPDRVAFSGRERHSSVRYNSLGYPQRSIRLGNYLLIQNFTPERWPAGAPVKYGGNTKYPTPNDVKKGKLGDNHSAYHDIDGCPTLTYMVENHQDQKVGDLLQAAVAHRPKFELFDVSKDPSCLDNLAADSQFEPLRRDLAGQLHARLKADADPRVTGNGDIWETYPRYSKLRWFPKPQWARDNPEKVPEQPWLEKVRPGIRTTRVRSLQSFMP